MPPLSPRKVLQRQAIQFENHCETMTKILFNMLKTYDPLLQVRMMDYAESEVLDYDKFPIKYPDHADIVTGQLDLVEGVKSVMRGFRQTKI